MNILAEEQVTLPSHSFIYNPETFLESVNPENPTQKTVPYQYDVELQMFGINTDVHRILAADENEQGDDEFHYEYHLLIWGRSCISCGEQPDMDSVHPGDKVAILGFGEYVIIRKDKLENS